MQKRKASAPSKKSDHLRWIRAITLERVLPVTNPGASIEDSVRRTRRLRHEPRAEIVRREPEGAPHINTALAEPRVEDLAEFVQQEAQRNDDVRADAAFPRRRSGGGRVSGRTKACGTMRVARRGRALCRRKRATRRGHTPGAQGSRRRELVDGLSEGVATWTDQAPAGSDPAPNRRSVRIERRTEGVAQLRFLERDDEPLKVGERQRQQKRRPQLVQQACLSEVGE